MPVSESTSAGTAHVGHAALKADLVLTMDKATTAEVKAIVGDAPVEMLGDYVGTGEEVDDPYGGPRCGYRQAAEQLDRLVDAVIRRLQDEIDAAPTQPFSRVAPCNGRPGC